MSTKISLCGTKNKVDELILYNDGLFILHGVPSGMGNVGTCHFTYGILLFFGQGY